MSRELVRNKIRQKADLRGLQNEESVPISLKERYEGTAVGGAVYHNPKFTMDLVQPVGRKVGGRRKKVKEEPEDRENEREEEEQEEPEEVSGGRYSGYGKYRGGAKKAEKLGRAYMEKMMEFDPEMKKLVGSGLFDKFVKGLSEFAKGAAYPLKAIAKVGDVLPLPPPLNIVSKASKLLEGVDDPQFAKDLGIGLKKKGGRARIQSPLQIVHPNVKGAGMNTKDFVDVPLQQQRTNVRGGIKMTIKDIEKAIPMPKRGSGMTSEREQERKGGRKTSSWIQFVKQYAKENNMKYSDALKEAGKHYKK
jgi:hypothetical protein